MHDLKTLADKPNLHIIHYSCGEFLANNAGPPPVFNIAVQEPVGGNITSFGTSHRENELDELARFSDYVAKHKDAFYLHFNMRDDQYGFEAIARRHRELAKKTDASCKPHVPPIKNRIDLKALFQRKYGDNFVEHKRFNEILRLNGYDDDHVERMFPTPVKSWLAFDAANQWETLRRSDSDKVRGLRKLLRQERDGQLKLGQRATLQLGRVKVFGADQTATIDGKRKPLSIAQYAKIRALMEAGPNGLTIAKLGSVKTLNRLRDSDSDWSAVVLKPEGGLGYRIACNELAVHLAK